MGAEQASAPEQPPYATMHHHGNRHSLLRAARLRVAGQAGTEPLGTAEVARDSLGLVKVTTVQKLLKAEAQGEVRTYLLKAVVRLHSEHCLLLPAAYLLTWRNHQGTFYTADFGIMNVYPNEFGTSLEGTVCIREEQDNAILNMCMERKNLVLQFLQSDLSPQVLEYHHKKVELLKKCYYYIEVLPSRIILRDQNRVLIPTDIFQIIDPWRLQRMKKVARTQIEIQLVLLTDLLEQLQRGREELACYIGTSDLVTFLSEWESLTQKLSNLSELMNKFLSLQVPGKLHTKHRLVSYADMKGTRIPNIKLFLSTKMPVMFDRKESVAHKNWAHLKWFTENQESPFEQYELHFRLLKHETQTEVGQRGIVAVSCNTCVVYDLLPDRSYEFTIRRAETYTLVYETWHDTITLMTVNSAEDSSTCEPEERGDRKSFLIFST